MYEFGKIASSDVLICMDKAVLGLKLDATESHLFCVLVSVVFPVNSKYKQTQRE